MRFSPDLMLIRCKMQTDTIIEDHFSKFHKLYTLKDKKASTIARHVYYWMVNFGIMEILQSDNSTEFKGACTELLRRYRIKAINGRH